MMSTTWLVLLTVALGQMNDEFHQDFRSGDLHPGLSRFGPNVDRVMRDDSGGLRIALPPNRASGEAVGIEPRFRVSGDFELTLTYELLDVKPPESGMGSGVKIWAKVDGSQFQAVTLSHMLTPAGESVFEALLATGDVPAEREFQRNRQPATARRGRLRISRQADSLSFLVAEDRSEEFQQLHSAVAFTGDLMGLRISANTSGATSALTVRLVDLQIRADALPGKPVAPPKRWPWKTILFSLIGVACVGAAGWGVKHYRGR